jgi:hypothetical protein
MLAALWGVNKRGWVAPTAFENNTLNYNDISAGSACLYTIAHSYEQLCSSRVFRIMITLHGPVAFGQVEPASVYVLFLFSIAYALIF